MVKTNPQINFRLEPELAQWLKQYAKQNRRSITTVLTILIEQEKNRVSQPTQTN